MGWAVLRCFFQVVWNLSTPLSSCGSSFDLEPGLVRQNRERRTGSLDVVAQIEFRVKLSTRLKGIREIFMYWQDNHISVEE